MKSPVPRLRMFAGPNGSGKSTLKSLLGPKLLGAYVNPDEIEKQIRIHSFFQPSDYGVVVGAGEILDFFRDSSLLTQVGMASVARRLIYSGGKLDFRQVAMNSYLASVAADFVRRKLMAQQTSFTMETVMSSRDKVEMLESAQNSGYRTYLYFVATDDPEINVARVQSRVAGGGHDVPVDKIKSRYYRSLDLLLSAIRRTHRAYIFDNSNHDSEKLWIAEVTDGEDLVVNTEEVPAWFKRSVLDKIDTPAK